MFEKSEFKLGEYRYYVDCRIGCCAIIDTKLPMTQNGRLFPENKNVVKYWEGLWDDNKEIWYLPVSIENEAMELCKKMNTEFKKTGEQ